MNRIREIRHLRGMSQTDLAQFLGIHQTAVSQWENGRTSPDAHTLTRMAEHFGLSVDYILGLDSPPAAEIFAEYGLDPERDGWMFKLMGDAKRRDIQEPDLRIALEAVLKARKGG